MIFDRSLHNIRESQYYSNLEVTFKNGYQFEVLGLFIEGGLAGAF